MSSSFGSSYKYPNPSPLAPKDATNGSINETFVFNCPKCASHFQSTQLLEQHLHTEHDISYETNYKFVTSFQNGDDQEQCGDNDESNEDNEEEDVNGQDIPYSDGQNVVSCVHIIKYVKII